ncbi:MAG: substrate-binding domain-containing protein, partial [Myxococcaceae bacterium]
ADLLGTLNPIPRSPPGVSCTQVGTDALVVVVREDAPADSISSQQLTKVVSGAISDWSALGGASSAIVVVLPAAGTDLRSSIDALGLAAGSLSRNTLEVSSLDVHRRVARSGLMLGLSSRGAIKGAPHLKVLKIDGIAAHEPGYPFQRPITLCHRSDDTGGAAQLVKWLSGKKARTAYERPRESSTVADAESPK